MDSLPDEMVVHILTLVEQTTQDAHGLLDLRLVCRRWARLALWPAVWRGRALCLTGPAISKAEKEADRAGRGGGGLAVLKMCPALAVVRMGVANAVQGRRLARALAKTKCKIRRLSLSFVIRVTLSRDLKRALENLDGPLEELHVYMQGANASSATDFMAVLHAAQTTPRVTKCPAAAPLLAAVDALRSLKSLTLGSREQTCAAHAKPELDYRFSGLKALQRVRLLPRLSEACARSVLLACRATLLSAAIECGDLDVVDALAQCVRLRELTVRSLCLRTDWEETLRKSCPDLRTVRFEHASCNMACFSFRFLRSFTSMHSG